MAAPYSLIARSKLASNEWDRLRVALDQREMEVVLVLQRPRGGELVLGHVDADRTRPAPCQPR